MRATLPKLSILADAFGPIFNIVCILFHTVPPTLKKGSIILTKKQSGNEVNIRWTNF